VATCPVCQSAIEITAQHHGTLFTCPRCSAVFFVDWSGTPEVAASDESASDPHAAGTGVQAEENFSPQESFQTVDSESFPPQENFRSSEAESFPSDNAREVSDFAADPEPYASREPFNSSDSSEPEATSFEPLQSSSNDSLSGIADFGNAETGSAALSYTLTIAGIDSASVRADLKEALSDSKFGWDVRELIGQIKDGVLTIRSVSAIKAGILVQRIKFLPIQISWRQDVLSGSV
jgi:endogenous inhibitor of DNA gyrase (YacG/DUF329 family)